MKATIDMLEESYKSSDTWKEILRRVTEISRQVSKAPKQDYRNN